jgi:hypothetical protein
MWTEEPSTFSYWMLREIAYWPWTRKIDTFSINFSRSKLRAALLADGSLTRLVVDEPRDSYLAFGTCCVVAIGLRLFFFL